MSGETPVVAQKVKAVLWKPTALIEVPAVVLEALLPSEPPANMSAKAEFGSLHPYGTP